VSFFFQSLGKRRRTWGLDGDRRGVIFADVAGETPVADECFFAGWMEADVVVGGLGAVGTPLRHGRERESGRILMEVFHFRVRRI
jgi:hypothetical protein